LDFMVQNQDQKRFNQLLNGVDMPAHIRSDQYIDMIASLGFGNVSGRKTRRHMNYTVVSELPIILDANTRFFGSYFIQFNGSSKSFRTSEYVSFQENRLIELTIDGEVYSVDFAQIIDSLVLTGEGDSNSDIKMAPIPIVSKKGVAAILLILDGKFRRYDNTFIDGSFDIALVLPN